ncbi:MAG TPA: NfeD family protein [Frankiaceae bacterium]|nr:NfeD family protein [Frankiaceae bacterium]
MTTARRAWAWLFLVVSALGLAALLPRPAAAQDAPGGRVSIVQIGGAFDSAYADFLVGEIRRAERAGDTAIVLRLNSSGTIETDADRLVQAVATSRVPIATWVGPSGRHARGAATRIWYAGDLRLVATGAKVGPAYPTDVGGDDAAPAGSDLPPALQRGPDLDADALVAQGIAHGKAGTLFEALRALDGKSFEGRTITLDQTKDAVRFAKPGPVVAVRQALASNPTLVYLLLLTGIGAIVFEAFQPGFGPAGYAGGILVLLAAYGLVSMPTNPVGLALLLLGIGGMALDVRRDAIGPPTWAGAVLAALGSWWLVHTDGPELRPALWATVVGILGSLLFYGIVMTVVLRALRGQSAQLGQALVGRSGEVRSTLNPQGHVLVEGALWRARAVEWDGPVAAGTPVRVTGVDEEALVLDVAPLVREG